MCSCDQLRKVVAQVRPVGRMNLEPCLTCRFFFCYQQFLFLFFFHTQHNRISKIKQNKTADTYSTSQGSIKREGEREGQQEHKSHSFK